VKTSIFGIAIAVLFSACHVSRQVTQRDLESKGREFQLVSVVRTDGNTLDFSKDPTGFAILRDSIIVRTHGNGITETIQTSEVDLGTAQRRYAGGEKAAGIVVGLVVAISVTYFVHYTVGFPF
jgi:hypothetical protein